MKQKEVKEHELHVGSTYLIEGKEYTYDGYSTFWNFRMYGKDDKKLRIFQRGKVTIFESEKLST